MMVHVISSILLTRRGSKRERSYQGFPNRADHGVCVDCEQEERQDGRGVRDIKLLQTARYTSSRNVHRLSGNSGDRRA